MRPADLVEQFFREGRIPYVAVAEAQRASLPDDPARDDDGAPPAFDFVAYFTDAEGKAANWLVQVEDGADHGTAMEWWQDRFGEGFRAVYAVVTPGGVHFRSIEGPALQVPTTHPRPIPIQGGQLTLFA